MRRRNDASPGAASPVTRTRRVCRRPIATVSIRPQISPADSSGANTAAGVRSTQRSACPERFQCTAMRAGRSAQRSAASAPIAARTMNGIDCSGQPPRRVSRRRATTASRVVAGGTACGRTSCRANRNPPVVPINWGSSASTAQGSCAWPRPVRASINTASALDPSDTTRYVAVARRPSALARKAGSTVTAKNRSGRVRPGMSANNTPTSATTMSRGHKTGSTVTSPYGVPSNRVCARSPTAWRRGCGQARRQPPPRPPARQSAGRIRPRCRAPAWVCGDPARRRPFAGAGRTHPSSASRR